MLTFKLIQSFLFTLIIISGSFAYRSQHQTVLRQRDNLNINQATAPTFLLQTKQEVSSSAQSKLSSNKTDQSSKVELKSKTCESNKVAMLPTQLAICQTCNATSVFQVNGKYWTDIPFTPIQKEKAQKLFKLLDSTLQMSNFTMGFSDTNICFGSQKIHGKHNLFGTLNALGVYDFSDVKLNKLFDFSLEVMPYNALFWGKWQNAGFDQVFFKINSNTTLPSKTSKDELKLQLQVIDIDTLLVSKDEILTKFQREVRFEGKIDYPGRQNLEFDPFQITLSHQQLKSSNLVEVIVKPQKNTTVSEVISPVTSPKFLEQIPSPRGVSNIDNMGIKQAQFVLQITKNQKPSSKGSYSYRLAQTKLQLKQINKISVNPQLSIQNIQSSLMVKSSIDQLNGETFLFTMQMIGTSILGDQKDGTKKFITSIEYSDSTQQYGFKLTPFDKHKAILTIANVQKYLAHMISAKDVDVRAVPKGIDKNTKELVQRLALDSLVIQNPQIQIKYRPYQVIKVVGTSSIYKKRDTDMQILLTNNQGRVQVVTGVKFKGQNNAMTAMQQVFNINHLGSPAAKTTTAKTPAKNAQAADKSSTLAKVNNTTSSATLSTQLPQQNSLANFKTNFQISQIVFIISRNDIKIKDIPGLARINSGVLVDQMVLNEGLNLKVNAQLPTQCTDSAVFCFFLRRLLEPINLTLFSKVYNGTAELSGQFKKPMVLDEQNVQIIEPALVIEVQANQDINLKIKGKMENFKVFINKNQTKVDYKSKEAKQQAKNKNLQPVFKIEIVNHLNVQLRVIAQSAEVVKAQTSPKQMVEFTQLRLTSIIPKNTTKFTQVKLSGLGVFGQKCLTLPKGQDNTPKIQVLDKGSKQLANKVKPNFQKTVQNTQTLSDNCYASWLQFGDQLIDLSGKQKPAFYGIVKSSTFSQFLRPFIILKEKDTDYMSFFRFNFISAISDDFTLRQKWVRLQFDPYMLKQVDSTVPGYRYHAPVVFMGVNGTLTGTIVPKTQKIDAQIDLQPVLIAKQNIKILSINYDYIQNKGTAQNQITLQRAITHIQYYPNIPHQQQVYIDTQVQLFEVQNTTRITVTRSLVSFDIDQARIFNGTIPFLVRVTGPYNANLRQVTFRCHGQLGSNQARIALQNDINSNLAKKRDQASGIIWMINSQKSKTLSNLSLVKKTRVCNKDSCPFITQCEEGEKKQPLLSCKDFQTREKCVSQRQICPHYKEQCVKSKKQCARYDLSSGKCLKEYEVCEQWQNTCTSKLSKICTDYEIEEIKDNCLQYSFDCKTIKKRSQECIHRCLQGQKLEHYFDQRLKFHISLQNRVLSLFQWREYLYYLNDNDKGNDVPLVQIVSVSFDSQLNEYKNAINIEVLIKVQLSFEDEKQFVVIKTNAEVLQERDLLVNQISNAIIKHIALKLDIDDYQLWKNLLFVQDLIQNVIDDKKMLSINKEITQTQSDKKEHDWIIQQLKNMKYNELGQTEGQVIEEKLRVKKDGGEFLPSSIQILMEKIATSKERIIQFEYENRQENQQQVIINMQFKYQHQGKKKEGKETIKDQVKKKNQAHKKKQQKKEQQKKEQQDKKKEKQGEDQKIASQQVVSQKDISPATKELQTAGKNHTTIKNGIAPESY